MSVMLWFNYMDSTDMEFDGTATDALKNEGDAAETDANTNIVDVDSTNETSDVPNPPKRRKAFKKSMVWDHFKRLKGDPKDPHTQCEYCGVVYACHSKRNGTGTMKNHLENYKQYSYQKKRDPAQVTLSFKTKAKDNFEDNTSQLICESYSLKSCREALVEMVIVDELSFKFVEGK
ncbi:uncharacterized protein LOC120079832 [Benincasa hispida]|uniref:uncharacterized protein LOC120079832 n=1 Tax=Benincasa hispida TaxID=102211 RepID=UPI001900AB5A|nr:uncharacterized protein LOC120079832 [Benincasa hispida]